MFALTTLLTSSLLAADVRIDQVLPENTIAFASIDDISVLVSHLQTMEMYDAVFDMASIDRGPWSIPKGQAGWGLYPVVDFESGTVGVGMFAMLESDDAAFATMMKQGFEGYAESNETEIELIDISGRDVWSVQYDFEFPEDALQLPMDFGELSTLYFAHSDGFILFGTEYDGFSKLFSLIDGDASESSLATNDVYDALMTRCGTEGEVEAGVLLTNFADTFMQMDTSGMGMMILPIVKSIFGDIDGLAQTMTLAPSEEVILTCTYAVLMEEGRDGLMGLVGAEAPAVDIPLFVADDTIMYSQNSIDFHRVVSLVKDVTASNPMLAMQMNSQMIEQMEAGISMYMSTLGSETHFMITGSEPYTGDSIGFMMAAECVNEEALSNVLGMTMPAMGASPTDFLGNQIFSMDLGASMMMPMPMDLSFSVAVGGGYVLVGSQFSVENALRAIANPKESRSDHGLNAAASFVSHDIVSGWGYGDMAKVMQMQKAMSMSMDMMNDEMYAQIEEFDPEMAAEMRAEAEQGLARQNALLDAMSKMFGPMAWNINADDSGFTSSIIFMNPK
tara:strand:- start:3329 stop:5011 length:1683 start_codon:yes stop_codon:yes gene_type:complete